MADEPGLTLVTVLFDLAGREGSPRRTVEHYLDAGAWLFALDRDLVVFADPEVAPEVARRAGPRTTIVPVALEEVAAHRLLDRVATIHARRPPRGWDPVKDTPLYSVTQWARFDLVERAIADHVTGPGPVGLIDIDPPGRPDPADDPFATAPDRIRLLMMRGFSTAVLAERERYYGARHGLVAGGFITGGQVSWRRLAALVRDEVADALDQGMAPTGEQLLATLCAREPDLFAFHHGDYADMFANALGLRGGAANLAFQLRVSRTHDGAGDWIGPSGFELCRQIVTALDEGVLEAAGADLASLLDECFLAAYGGAPGGRELAAHVRDLYREAVRTDPGARDAFLLHEIRMRTNFAFLDG